MNAHDKTRGPLTLISTSRRFRRWMVVVVALAPIVYVASFGPACWISALPKPSMPGESPRLLMRLYFPIGAFIHRTQSQNNTLLIWWITLGARKGRRVTIPSDARCTGWYGFTAE